MPLFTKDLEVLKKDLAELRHFKHFYGYRSEELKLEEYARVDYNLSNEVREYLESFVKEQEQDLNWFSKSLLDTVPEEIKDDENSDNKGEGAEKTDSEKEAVKVKEVKKPRKDNSNNYFKAPSLELLFEKVDFYSYQQSQPAATLLFNDEVNDIVKNLDRVFVFEIERIKANKSTFSSVATLPKIEKVRAKVIENKINEAAILMSRFYNENKQEVILGYLYSEILYAKTALGNQKSLSKAREVASTVCFLTDRSDEELISYYRYIYVCREFNYDKEKSFQLFRDFVLLNEDKIVSPTVLTQRNGFYLKCLILFLHFDFNNWNIYEIESIYSFVYRSVSGGAFYLYFIRQNMLPHLDTVRHSKFITVEESLYNIKNSHEKLMHSIHEKYDTDGLPKDGSKSMHTVGQKYIQTLFLNAKLPDFSDYIVNTSLSGISYFDNTANDRMMLSLGMTEHDFWRSWISKISDESSLQRSDIIPLEQVFEESTLLAKYEKVAIKAYEYEIEIYNREEYQEIRNRLTDVTSRGIISVILGENKYSVYDYGLQWTGIKEYFVNSRMASDLKCQLISDLLLQKGKAGLLWNLEDLQMMLEAISLIIDNKRIGLQARLEQIIEAEEEKNVDDQYMSLTEHISLYWWLYVLLISLLTIFFKLIL